MQRPEKGFAIDWEISKRHHELLLTRLKILCWRSLSQWADKWFMWKMGKRRTRKKFSPLIKKTHGRRPAVHTKSNSERLILILNGQWRRSLISFYGSVLKLCACCAIYPRNLFQSRRCSVVIRTELTNNGMCSKSNEFPSSLAPVLQKLRQLALNTPIWP